MPWGRFTVEKTEMRQRSCGAVRHSMRPEFVHLKGDWKIEYCPAQIVNIEN